MSWFNENGFQAGTEESLSALFNLSTDSKINGPTLKELLPEVLSGKITDPAKTVEELVATARAGRLSRLTR